MHLTETSLLLPLCLLYAFAPGSLLYVVRYFGLIGSGAILVIGDFGLAPVLVPATLFIGNILLQLLLGRIYPGREQVMRIAAPFIVGGLYALATAVVLPWVFDGAVQVWPQKMTAGGDTMPLHFGMGNITQALYLAVDLGFFVAAAWFLAGRGGDLGKHFTAYLATGYIVGFICLWQLANRLAGVPFPSDFLFSNPGWALLTDQSIGGIPRINGPFTEPAALASYLCGFAFCAGWLLLQGHRHRALLPLLLLSLLCVGLSTSTSGIVAVAAGLIYALISGLTGAARGVSHRLLRVILLAGVVAGLGAVVLPLFAPGLVASVDQVASASIDKPNSDSYDQRTQMDSDSLGIVLETYGLGAGYGSNRPSSLIPSLLSQVGVVGVGIIVVFIVRLWRAVLRAQRLARTREDLMLLHGFAAAIAGLALVAVISGPGIPAADFYLTLALLVATIVRIENAAAPRRAVRAARARQFAVSEIRQT